MYHRHTRTNYSPSIGVTPSVGVAIHGHTWQITGISLPYTDRPLAEDWCINAIHGYTISRFLVHHRRTWTDNWPGIGVSHTLLAECWCSTVIHEQTTDRVLVYHRHTRTDY